MRVTIVGCSGSFPGPDSPASCYLVEHHGYRILLDMGNGSLGGLHRHTDIYGIDAVLVSHLHVDHFIDLCSYYVALRYRPGGSAPIIPVWGPPGTEERLVAAYGLPPGTDMSRELDVRRIDDSFRVGPFTVTTALMDHPVPSRAIRVQADGRSLTYSGDTGPTPALAELAADTDLALFEASFLSSADNPPHLHMSGAEAAAAAAEAGARRLVLTHLVPWHPVSAVADEAQVRFPGAVTAYSGLTIDL